MSKWIYFSIDERKAMIQGVVEAKNIDEAAAEKDWWVTAILYALFHTKASEYLLFKGGTSLSKGWDIIDRFSEDIDIALKREERFLINSTSNTQLAKVRRTARHYIVRELPLELHSALSSLGITNFTVEPEIARIKEGVSTELRADTHPSVIFVNYDSVVPETSEYV